MDPPTLMGSAGNGTSQMDSHALKTCYRSVSRRWLDVRSLCDLGVEAPMGTASPTADFGINHPEPRTGEGTGNDVR